MFKKKLYIPSDIITKVEIDRKLFIYDDSNSISFSEIEDEIWDRISDKIRLNFKNQYKGIIIHVIGEYPEENEFKPFVYIKGLYDNCNFYMELDKKILKNVKNIYDYLATEVMVRVDSIIEGYNNEKN